MKEFNNEMNNFIMNHRQASRSWYKLADEFNQSFGTHYSWEKIRSHYRRNLEKEAQEMRAEESVSLKESGEQISQIKIAMTREQSKDPNYLLEAHGYSSNDWKIIDATSNIWDGYSSDGPKIMYQSKIRVKPKQQNEVTLEEMIDLINDAVIPIEVPRKTFSDSDKNLLIPLADLHFGITTDEVAGPYLEKIIDTIGDKEYKEIHIVQLGDVIHSDSAVRGQTTKGTRITDINIVTALEDATAFFDRLINVCYKHSDDLFFHAVAGNHDTTTGYMFMKILESRYMDYAVWDVDLQWRTAFKMGDIMIGATHGDFVKNKEVITFAGEYPHLWESSERYILTGHLHSKKTMSINSCDAAGITILQQPTIKPCDDYETKNGYTLSKKGIMLYEFNESHLLAELYVKV